MSKLSKEWVDWLKSISFLSSSLPSHSFQWPSVIDWHVKTSPSMASLFIWMMQSLQADERICNEQELEIDRLMSYLGSEAFHPSSEPDSTLMAESTQYYENWIPCLNRQSDYLKVELDKLKKENKELSESLYSTSCSALESQLKRVASHEMTWIDHAESFQSEYLIWKAQMKRDEKSQYMALDLISCALDAFQRLEDGIIDVLKSHSSQWRGIEEHLSLTLSQVALLRARKVKCRLFVQPDEETSELAHLLDSLFTMEHDQSILANVRMARDVSLSKVSPLVEKWKSWRMSSFHLLQSLWMIQNEDHVLVDKILSTDFELETTKRALGQPLHVDAATDTKALELVSNGIEPDAIKLSCLKRIADDNMSVCQLSSMVHQVKQDILQDQHPMAKELTLMEEKMTFMATSIQQEIIRLYQETK